MTSLAHPRCGHTFALLAAGFGIGVAAAHRYVPEATEVLAALAPTLEQAILDSTRFAPLRTPEPAWWLYAQLPPQLWCPAKCAPELPVSTVCRHIPVPTTHEEVAS